MQNGSDAFFKKLSLLRQAGGQEAHETHPYSKGSDEFKGAAVHSVI
jgi:hypothetical protein